MKNLEKAEFVHKTTFSNVPGSVNGKAYMTDIWTLQDGQLKLADVYDYDLYKLIEGAINGRVSTVESSSR